MENPTVGIVGLGFGRAHIPAFQANGCRVVAVCQRAEASARVIADRYGVDRVFTRWDEMLERSRPEIVVIATPPRLHLPIALRALAGGAHVLCEKPLALTQSEARAMVEAAARAGRVAMTGFNWRSPAGMQRFHAMVQEGALGRVFHVHARFLGSRFADEATAPTWRMDRAEAGHGAMGDMGAHLIDLVRWNFGDFVRVAATAGVAYPSRAIPGGTRPADAEDFCTVVGELATGASVTLAVSRAAHGMNEHTLEASGSRSTLAYRFAREGPRWFTGQLRGAFAGGALESLPVPDETPAQDDGVDQLEAIGRRTIAPLVRRFLEGIERGITPAPSFADGCDAQAVLDAVLESLAQRRWADVAPAAKADSADPDRPR
jgi:predicted dehydrogenase